MSMLSARCNELRELALWLDDEFYDVEAAKVRDAADTILELRDDLQRANAAVQDAEHDESMAWDRIRKAEAENAKLRELSAEMYPYARAFTQLGVNLGCNDSVSYDWYLQLRELGIEVSE